MQSKPKTNSIVTHRLNEGGTITFIVKDAGEFTFDPAKASDENRAYAPIHGWVQRISDKAAISRNPETGRPATGADKMAAMQALAEFYESGTASWRMVAATGPKGPDAGLIITAMCRALTSGDVDKANSLVDKYAEKKAVDRNESLKAWAKTAEVAEAITTIKAERARVAAKDLPSADDMLGEMEETEE